ncbi:phage baseplate assembly protein V [Pantoea agglomerans]|uniref:phage baseplate assembly protein V n=1 Tax=Enterobacter agglomerans TaxID=549 RepID=UPI00057F6246|nr:phage baseplate assembly protein V [Pantoea agglomerans]KIC86285.1 baseplate assembly protein [Pantoea agglomerans]MBA5703251.1 phage baseplate assembly protein V [Pantoea agglomerans]SUB04294.1 Phage P2 baseplate assembly protein gpV [Pantoea agglomerans]
MNEKLTEIMRLITNLIRTGTGTGTVSDVDPANWLCRVKTGDLETNWINWLTCRAGNTRTWWQPSIGEQVVLLSLGGNLETAFALPAIYSDAFPPPDYSENGSTTVFNDGGWFQYEPDTGQLLIKNIKSVRIEAADGIQLITDQLGVEASQMLINSETVINGAVTQGGGDMSSNGVIADKHKHDKVKSGGDISGGPQ